MGRATEERNTVLLQRLKRRQRRQKLVVALCIVGGVFLCLFLATARDAMVRTDLSFPDLFTKKGAKQFFQALTGREASEEDKAPFRSLYDK